MSKTNLFQKSFWTMAVLFIFMAFLAGCKVAPENSLGGTTPKLPQPKTLSDPEWIALDKAIQTAASGRDDVLAFLLYRVTIDDVKFSTDGNLALVWIALVDKKTGAVQSAEPGLVIAHKSTDAQWSVVFQADSNFASELQAIPESMLSNDAKQMYMPAMQQQTKGGTVYTGYHLPWAKGETKYLTGSIGHVYTYKSCPTTCLYAFDFADGTQFAVLAAKAGTVKYAVWKYADGNTTDANYLILEDTTTTPTTYQVYFHLKQNSIPTALRTVGAKVAQGQFIGYADDTGYSTGNHLHFMVHTNSTSYWGTSVDITFEEVSINGGRPRLCSEASAYPQYGTQCSSTYTSQNGDSAVPTGTITSPAAYSTISNSTLTVTGTMADDTAVAAGQLMYNSGKGWTNIGQVLSGNSFSTDIDLCAAKIPDGKFFLSLVVTDTAGKTSVENTGLTELTKSYTCPVDPPVCTPGENQVALTSEINFQGTCQLLDIGKYPDLDKLDNIKNDQVSSVQVGSGVSLLLYPDTDYGGTLDFFQASDADLDENPIGLKNAASAKVVAHINLPSTPVITIPAGVTSEDDIQFSWTADEGVKTQASLSGPDGYSSSTDWLDTTVWHIGTLVAGDYTLTVGAKNLAGIVTASQEFTVSAPIAAPVAALNSLPQVTNSTAVALSWQVTSGADVIGHFEIRYRIFGGEWQNWETQPGADDRSAVFSGELNNTYEFQIRAVATNGKALDFSDTAETSTYVTNSCVGDSFEGTSASDNDKTGAVQITIGVKQTHNWCPSGDVDWLTFQATKGQQLTFSAEPTGTHSAAVMMLYDTDGVTLLGSNYPSDASSASSLEWTVPADGIYYLRLSPKDGKTYGGDASYTIEITQASTVNTGNIVCGSIVIPLAAGGAVALAKSLNDKKKKTAKRAGWK